MGFMCILSLPAPGQTPRVLVARNRPEHRRMQIIKDNEM